MNTTYCSPPLKTVGSTLVASPPVFLCTQVNVLPSVRRHQESMFTNRNGAYRIKLHTRDEYEDFQPVDYRLQPVGYELISNMYNICTMYLTSIFIPLMYSLCGRHICFSSFMSTIFGIIHTFIYAKY